MGKFRFILVLFVLVTNTVHAAWWVSIFIDQNTGIGGGSYNYPTNQEANEMAKYSCEKKHQDKGIKANCVYAISASNACVAAYWSPVNKKVGTAYGPFENDVKKVAYNGCVKLGGENCQLSLIMCGQRFIR